MFWGKGERFAQGGADTRGEGKTKYRRCRARSDPSCRFAPVSLTWVAFSAVDAGSIH